MSLPVGLSVRSVAWHGGRRGGGAVRLTQGVACPTKQAHVHPHTDTIFVLCETSVIWLQLRVCVQKSGFSFMSFHVLSSIVRSVIFSFNILSFMFLEGSFSPVHLY